MEKGYVLRLYDTDLLSFSLSEQGIEGLKAQIHSVNDEARALFPLDLSLIHILLTGLLAGLGAALLVSLVFAYFHLNLQADATICGTAVNTFASGFTVLLLFTLTGQKGTSGSLKSFSFPTVHIPVIEDLPVIGSVLSGHNLIMTYVALLAVLVVWFLLYKMCIRDSAGPVSNGNRKYDFGPGTQKGPGD